MADLHVDIVTPERLVFSGRATDLRAPGWEGEVDILPGHTLYLTLLHGGVLSMISDQGEQRFVVGRGFAEAGPERVTILTEYCVAADQVDREQAAQDLAAAQDELTLLNSYDEQAAAKVRERIELAQASLDI